MTQMTLQEKPHAKRQRRPAAQASKGAERNAVLRKRIGARFRAARDINGWGQAEAAEMFGYGNSTQLSLFEDGKRMPPHEQVLKAHEVYGVSIDYLYGVSDEPERDPKVAERQAMMAQIQKILTDNSALIATQFQVWLHKGAPAVATSRSLLNQAAECTAAIQRLRDLNQEQFDGELRGSASVLRAMDALNNEILTCRALLDRSVRMGEDVINKVAERNGLNAPLFDQMG